MSTAEDQAATDVLAQDEPAPVLSRALRQSGRRSSRILALASLITALGATGYVFATTMKPAVPVPIEEATADAWKATSKLSGELRELRPGASRNPARALVKRAADEVDEAGKRVGALDLPTSDTPLRSRVLRTLRADAAWIDAVGSTLANPRSPRRADLSRLAKRAATMTALVAEELEGAQGSVGGTGRLLSATKPD